MLIWKHVNSDTQKSDWQIMKYVVTGGAGFIGSHIAKSLLESGNTVTILDNLNTGKIENIKEFANEVDFVNGDISIRATQITLCI